MNDYIRMAGWCPMGCGQTLLARPSSTGGAHIECYADGCPRPDAVSVILDNSETGHLIRFEKTTFTILHPLAERLDTSSLSCDLQAYCNLLVGPPFPTFLPGLYRATRCTDRPGFWFAVVSLDG